jgi:hypothetical protein
MMLIPELAMGVSVLAAGVAVSQATDGLGNIITSIMVHCSIALGTKSCGSIVMPATRAALYALKPALDSVEMDGIARTSRNKDLYAFYRVQCRYAGNREANAA